MAKKKASKKKVAAKAASHEKGKGTTVKEVMVDGPADEEQEPAAPEAIAPEAVCYSRSSVPRRGKGSGQNQHMTVVEHQDRQGAKAAKKD